MNSKEIRKFELQQIERTNIKDLALDQLKRYILDGDLIPGHRLPSERELAERLGIGRNSVREALKVLEAVGIVESRIGEGTFITAQTGASFGRTIGFSLAIWGGTVVEILEARLMFEIEAARVAAKHVTKENLQELATELQKMESSTDQPLAFLIADMNFHRIISKATQNTVVSRVICNLIDLLEEMLHEVEPDWLPTVDEEPGTHRSIYDALAAHDADAAGELMRQHLDFSTELWQALVSLGSAKTPTNEP